MSAKTKRVQTPTGYRYMVDGKFSTKAAYDRARSSSSSKPRAARPKPRTSPKGRSKPKSASAGPLVRRGRQTAAAAKRRTRSIMDAMHAYLTSK